MSTLIRTQRTYRHAVYKSADAPFPICYAAAASPAHALRIARQQGIRLTRTAYALRETAPAPINDAA